MAEFRDLLPNEALAEVDRALAQPPGEPEGRARLLEARARALADLGRRSEVAKAYRALLAHRRASGLFDYHDWVGYLRCLDGLARTAAAREAAAETTAFIGAAAPDPAEASYYLAYFYLIGGNRVAALKNAKHAVLLDRAYRDKILGDADFTPIWSALERLGATASA